MTDFAALLQLLVRSKVDFVIVGGIAAAAHGSARSTNDLDVVYSRKPENVTRLSAAVSTTSPYLRGAPPGLPFRFDTETVLRGLNFTLTTLLGDVDLLGEITGGEPTRISSRTRSAFGFSTSNASASASNG